VLSLSHPAIKNLLASSLLSMWSLWAYISNNMWNEKKAILRILSRRTIFLRGWWRK
jgi:hypothetical protein